MPYSEAASEATIDPVVADLQNSDSKQASEKALASLESSNPTNDPNILREQSEALVAKGVMPEMIILLNENPEVDSVLNGSDISAEGSLMRYMGNGDDLIGLNNANEMERLDKIIDTGHLEVDGITVDFTYDQRLVAAAVRANIPALDTFGVSGGDMTVGVADYDAMVNGDNRDLADESLMGAEAFIVNFSEPGSFTPIFGTETASRAQLEDAVANPQNYRAMTESQWRGLSYALEQYDDVLRGSQIGYDVDEVDSAAPVDYLDAKYLRDDVRHMDDQAMSAARERQTRIDENSHDYEDAWEVGRDSEPETPDEVVRAEESGDEPVPEKSAPAEESPDEPVPEKSSPAEESHDDSAEGNSDKQEEAAGSATTKYPMTGDTLTDPEKLKSGAFVTRDADGKPTTVYGVNGEEANYEYDDGELKSVKLADKDGNAKVFSRTEDGWEERGMSGSAVYNSKVDEVSVDKSNGNITAKTDGKQTVYDLGLTEAANKESMTKEMAAKEKEATAVKQKEEVAALEANLGRDVTVLSNGDLQFEIQDGDTLFEIRNDVAKAIKVEEISAANGMQIYDDKLVLSIAKENGIADIDVIRPGKLMVIPRDMLDQYMAS